MVLKHSRCALVALSLFITPGEMVLAQESSFKLNDHADSPLITKIEPACKVTFGNPAVMVIDMCNREITVPAGVKVDEAAVHILESLKSLMWKDCTNK
jgi:hypothetical protein